LGADSAIEQHFIPVTLIQPAQALVTVDLTVEGPFDNRLTGFVNHHKWFVIEERLRVVEENDLFDPI
jgi:hypothetical protein